MDKRLAKQRGSPPENELEGGTPTLWLLFYWDIEIREVEAEKGENQKETDDLTRQRLDWGGCSPCLEVSRTIPTETGELKAGSQSLLKCRRLSVKVTQSGALEKLYWVDKKVLQSKESILSEPRKS